MPIWNINGYEIYILDLQNTQHKDILVWFSQQSYL